MAEITPADAKAKIALLIKTLPTEQTGAVETSKRFAETDADFYQLILSINGTEARGVVITQEEFEQSFDDGVCQIEGVFNFSIELLAPYRAKKIAGKTSGDEFDELIWAITHLFNLRANWKLGFDGNKVKHQLIQQPAPVETKRWGEGQDADLAHYVLLTLAVEVRNHAG